MRFNQKTMTTRGALFTLVLLSQFFLLLSSSAIVQNNKSYGYVYWENGNPVVTARRGGLTNPTAANNPDIVVQTGHYSLRLDCDDLALTGYDALTGSDYMTALTQDVTNHTAAGLSLIVTKNRVDYFCESGLINSGTNLYVRLIEMVNLCNDSTTLHSSSKISTGTT
jgi:hypothetical protein